MESELINKFLLRNSKRKTKIAVVGDCGLDEYFYVDANRVSPEFPIPVLQSGSNNPKIVIPAMAGNVACQFKDWNVDLQFFSLLDKSTCSILLDNNIEIIDCILNQICKMKFNFFKLIFKTF